MQEIIADIDRWRADRQKIALATVVNTWGSSPRPIGAKMAVSSYSKISGSVSAGCVEGAVVQECVTALESNRGRLLNYGVSDDTAFSVGLMCGGEIEVFVRALHDPYYAPLRQAVLEGKCAALVSVIGGEENLIGRETLHIAGEPARGSLGDELDAAVREKVQAAMLRGKCERLRLESPQPVEIFIDVMAPLPVLCMIGGVHIAIALTRFARELGFRTLVIDPRKPFANPERFPHADRIINAYADLAFKDEPLGMQSAVALLAHDPKIDDPALIAALRSPAFYIGALGSQRTQAQRRERMHAAGFGEDEIARIHGPIGLKIGSRTPEEIAISILAEIIQVRNR